MDIFSPEAVILTSNGEIQMGLEIAAVVLFGIVMCIVGAGLGICFESERQLREKKNEDNHDA